MKKTKGRGRKIEEDEMKEENFQGCILKELENGEDESNEREKKKI